MTAPTRTLPDDKGKWCSTLVSGDDTSNTKTYAVGPVGEKPAEAGHGHPPRLGAAHAGLPGRRRPGQRRRAAAADPRATRDQHVHHRATCSSTRRPASATVSPISRPARQPAATGPAAVRAAPAGRPRPRSPWSRSRLTPGARSTRRRRTLVVDNPNVDVGGETDVQRRRLRPERGPARSPSTASPSGTITADSQGNFAGSIWRSRQGLRPGATS